MALIDCPDCGHPVSDAAYACPSCARPIHPPQAQQAPQAHAPAPTVQTIERTSKRYKGLQLAASLAVLLAILGFGMDILSGHAPGEVNGLFWLFGFGGYLYARIGAWWNNG